MPEKVKKSEEDEFGDGNPTDPDARDEVPEAEKDDPFADEDNNNEKY